MEKWDRCYTELATVNAFIRQEKIGVLQIVKKAAKQRNVKVRILMPTHETMQSKIQSMKWKSSDYISIRHIEQMSGTKATILVVDRKSSLVMELRDDSKMNFIEAIGLSTYSNSKAGVLSYVAIFENMWKQTELFQQVKNSNKQLEIANEKLKVHDKMQAEFINIAAHELRTPIQPILGLTEIVHSKTEDIANRELLDVVIRNAKRIQRLTEDILDVTKIESQSLKINKEQFELNEIIANAISDCKNQLKNELKENIKIELNFKENVFVEA
jgi:two-component system, OmpR family, sensor histidine kinase VicK